MSLLAPHAASVRGATPDGGGGGAGRACDPVGPSPHEPGRIAVVSRPYRPCFATDRDHFESAGRPRLPVLSRAWGVTQARGRDPGQRPPARPSCPSCPSRRSAPAPLPTLDRDGAPAPSATTRTSTSAPSPPARHSAVRPGPIEVMPTLGPPLASVPGHGTLLTSPRRVRKTAGQVRPASSVREEA